MRVIETITEMKAVINSNRSLGKTIGFVPTMGYLHEGHLSLAKRSVHDNDFTVMSIFVNPTQFGPNEDFEKYPRDMERDLQLAESAGVDVVFVPGVAEMYPDKYKTYVNVDDITNVLCGQSRPGHFKGVTTVVNKLFNIVEPHKAYFGQKDAQQVVVIEKMVRDLNMNLEIVTCPIIREPDGLALSSRNVYLDKNEREAAVILSKSLFETEKLIKEGEKSKVKVVEYLRGRINSQKLAAIDYIEVVSADSLGPINHLEGCILIALAVRFGKTRLIDNIMLEV